MGRTLKGWAPRLKVPPTEFGLYIQERRLQLNLTLEDLAERMSTSKTYVWGLEQGRHVPSLLQAGKLAKVLCTSVSVLFTIIQQDEEHYARAVSKSRQDHEPDRHRGHSQPPTSGKAPGA